MNPLPSIAESAFLRSAVPPLQAVAVAVYAVAQCLLALYASHRYLVLWRWRRSRGRGASAAPAPAELPTLTVQLPVYNERRVVERLVAAAAALDYPRDRIEIQVLDDSTDETRALAAAAVAHHAARGVAIRHLARDRRDGFKAGALAAGLREARGELIAVFDADFVPPPDFLRRLVPHFADPGVGMVQARWAHLNRSRSALTVAQAVMLDSHFLLEHQTRMAHRLFFNFNGTAGVWRRRCIEDAGGWAHDTLTEDLDLSYRAQLCGWRFAFDASVEAPAELPADMRALKSQQHRWAKGSIQTARKLLPAVWRAPLSPGVKLEALVHLTNNASYPLLLILALLLAPVVFAPSHASALWVWSLQAGVVLFGVLPTCLFLAAGQVAAGRPRRGIARDVGAALLLGIGLSLNNAHAVLAGLGSRTGAWERTPKSGEGGARRALPAYRSGPRWAGALEAGLACYFVALAAGAVAVGALRALPFIALLAAGFGAVGLGAWPGGPEAATRSPARGGASPG